MDKKGWIFFSVIVIALFGVLIYRSQSNKVSVSNVDPYKIQKASPENGEIGDHVLNPNENSIILIEYGDFQCPGCQSIYPTVHEVTEKYAANVQYIFRSYPLSYHANARAASAAAESAGLQDRFWDMFDIIYTNGSEWETAGATERTDVFLKYAKELGLDVNKFKEDMDSDRVKKKISFDTSLAQKSNVDATPTFILNGKKLNNSDITNVEGFSKVIDEALKENN